MNVKETLELISETRSLLIEDYRYSHGKEPSNKELLQHIKTIFKEGRSEDIVGETFLSEQELGENIVKILFVAAAMFPQAATSS